MPDPIKKIFKNFVSALLVLILIVVLLTADFVRQAKAQPSQQWTQTTQADFDAGEKVNLDITTSPGDIMLAKHSINQALSFDGIDDHATIPHSDNQNAYGDFTIEFWIKTSRYTDIRYSDQWLISKLDSPYPTNGWFISWGTDGKIRASIGSGQWGIWNTVSSSNKVSLNEWHHIALVKEGNTIRLYIDGVLSSTADFTGDYIASIRPIRIGVNDPWFGGLQNVFNGQIDDIRIWNKARDQTEIKDNMNHEILAQDSLVGYWKLNGNTNDSSGNNNHLIAVGPISVDGAPLSLIEEQYYPTGIFTSSVLDTEKFSDFENLFWNATIPDKTGSHSLKFQVASRAKSKLLGQALSFDGKDDYVGIPRVDNHNVSENFSVELWAKTDRYTDQWLLSKQTVSHASGWFISWGSDGLINAGIAQQWANRYLTVSSSNKVSLNEWHHIALVKEGNTIRLYIDGILSSTTDFTGDIHIGNNSGILIGTCGGCDWYRPLYFFNGQIDDIRIWNKARNQSEIQAKMNTEISPEAGLVGYWKFNSDANDSSGNNNHGTLVNGPTFAEGAETWNFVGLDGSSNTYYLEPGPIWSGHNGDRYLRYKVYFSTANNQYTPTLHDVTISYKTYDDITPPEIAVFSPEQIDYQISEDLTVNYIVTDDLSGVATSSATLDGQSVENGQIIDLFNLPLGQHIFKVTATDTAGNTSNKEVVFSIVATPSSLIDIINELIADGKIPYGLGRSLIASLEAAQKSISNGNTNAATGQLNAFINEVKAQSGKKIDAETASLLIQAAQNMIDTI